MTDEERWFPTHFAKSAKWMGHGAFSKAFDDSASGCGAIYNLLEAGAPW
jgi:hypothetical protein